LIVVGNVGNFENLSTKIITCSFANLGYLFDGDGWM